MFHRLNITGRTHFVTFVAFCCLSLAVLAGIFGAQAVFVLPGPVEQPGSPAAIERTLAECQSSLSTSILKRTDASPAAANQAAALRCGVLVGAVALSDLADADDI